MAVKIEQNKKVNSVTIAVQGKVDFHTVPELREAILNAVAQGKSVDVDLSDATYLDSSGIATLIEGLKAATEKGCALALVAPSLWVTKVLQIARLDTVFEIRDRL